MKWRYFWAFISTFGIFYFGAALLSSARATVLSPTIVDESVPFLSWTVWIYASEYFALPLAFMVTRSNQNLKQMVIAMSTAIATSFLVFIFYPTLMRRPVITGGSVSEQGMQLLHLVDPPTNCLPSLHVSLMILVAVYLMRESRAWGIFGWILAILVAISTLTTKQHYFVDVLGGIVVAAGSVWASERLTKVP